MICPTCHGRRNLLREGKPAPCPECEGRGEIHCCEGLQAQPEELGENPARVSRSQDAERARNVNEFGVVCRDPEKS